MKIIIAIASLAAALTGVAANASETIYPLPEPVVITRTVSKFAAQPPVYLGNRPWQVRGRPVIEERTVTMNGVIVASRHAVNISVTVAEAEIAAAASVAPGTVGDLTVDEYNAAVTAAAMFKALAALDMIKDE